MSAFRWLLVLQTAFVAAMVYQRFREVPNWRYAVTNFVIAWVALLVINSLVLVLVRR